MRLRCDNEPIRASIGEIKQELDACGSVSRVETDQPSQNRNARPVVHVVSVCLLVIEIPSDFKVAVKGGREKRCDNIRSTWIDLGPELKKLFSEENNVVLFSPPDVEE